MIEVLNIKEYDGELPNTYGYISLGNIVIPNTYSGDLYLQSSYFRAECKLGKKDFGLIICRLGNYSNIAIVLGDLPDIPGNLLIDQTELFNNLKIELNKLRADSYLKSNIGLEEKSECWWTKNYNSTFSIQFPDSKKFIRNDTKS